MKDIQINFIHFCDAATIDGSGKLNILGIFNKIILKEIPSKLPKFSLVVALIFEKKSIPKNRLEITIIGPKKETLDIKPPINIEFLIPKLNQEKKVDLNLILDILNLEFKNTGHHHVKIFLNGSMIIEKEILVNQITKN